MSETWNSLVDVASKLSARNIIAFKWGQRLEKLAGTNSLATIDEQPKLVTRRRRRLVHSKNLNNNWLIFSSRFESTAHKISIRKRQGRRRSPSVKSENLKFDVLKWMSVGELILIFISSSFMHFTLHSLCWESRIKMIIGSSMKCAIDRVIWSPVDDFYS